MDVRSATGADFAAMAELAGRLQSDPAEMIAYLGVEVDGILGDLHEVEDRSVSAVAFEHDELVGWLVGDTDIELGRVFWLGPFVESSDWAAVADLLYGHCSAALPAAMTQEEMAIDVRFERFERWAMRFGFAAEEGSLALRLETGLEPPTMAIRAAVADDVATFGALHDELFPGTHSTGRTLLLGGDDRHVRLLTEVNGEPAGYIAVEVHADGSGYIDYLGVAPSYRRRGLAADLVRAGVAALRRIDAEPVHLTVRESNVGARSLYASLGFVEESVITPLRKGFSLA